MDPDAHEHLCALCDKKYKCDDYGCEETPGGVCDECEKGMGGRGDE